MKRVLVTGGAGFIGSNFVRLLARERPGVRIVNLDAMTYAACPATIADLPSGEVHRFVEGDVCDGPRVEALLRDEGIDTIVHLAAESHVDRSIEGPAAFVRTNVVGTATLLDAARRVWLRDRAVDPATVRFHHVSTDEVYGTLAPDEPPWTVESPYAPRSPYAASKAASDHLVRAFAHTYGLPATISHSCNVFGPYQFPEKLVPLVVLHAIEGRPIPVYGDGLQVRDWIHVEDVCRALLAILARGEAGGTVHVSAGVGPTNLEMVRTICRLVDERHPDGGARERLVRHVADRPGHDRRYALDGGSARALGFAPALDLAAGLAATVDWYLARPDWVAAARDRPDYAAWMRKNYEERA